MLLAPEPDQGFRKPRALPNPAVDAGVTGGAKRDEQFFTMDPGRAVMDG